MGSFRNTELVKMLFPFYNDVFLRQPSVFPTLVKGVERHLVL